MNWCSLTNTISRLDYDWYSSNPDIATVSAYGTVQALDVKEDSIIKIMAVYREDPSKVFIKEFTILKETKTSYEDMIDFEIYMTVQVGVVTSINLNNLAVPTNILQNYSWSSFHEPLISVDILGRVNANSYGIGQTVIVLGNYKYNPRWRIVVYINIIA